VQRQKACYIFDFGLIGVVRDPNNLNCFRHFQEGQRVGYGAARLQSILPSHCNTPSRHMLHTRRHDENGPTCSPSARRRDLQTWKNRRVRHSPVVQ
jgi:hypothetical protein